MSSASRSLLVTMATVLLVLGGALLFRAPSAVADPAMPNPSTLLPNTSTLPNLPYVETNQTYRILVGMGALEVTVLSIRKNGLVSVMAAEPADFVGIKKGTVWWLNLHNALLVEAKDPRKAT